MSNNRWTPEEFEEAVTLFDDGYSFEDIGKELGRSRDAIKLKLNRNKLKASNNKKYCKELINCVHCNKEFIAYKRDNRRFCSQSCSASYVNVERTDYTKCGKCGKETTNKTYCSKKCSNEDKKSKKKKLKNKCKRCNKKTNNKKYCSNYCSHQYRREQRDKKIEENLGIGFSSRQVRNYLIKKFGRKCMNCGWDEKNPVTGDCPIEMNHIDGNSKNNHFDNVELLCPNCHSLTDNYKSLNNGNGRHERMERYHNGKSY